MLTAGKTMTEIAQELSLSVKTVSVYRTRVLEKLKLRTNAEIINYCLTHGMTL
jgi:DNA-binding NarL/FixJ family response regulator